MKRAKSTHTQRKQASASLDTDSIQNATAYNDELLNELASFLYDAYVHSKERLGNEFNEERGHDTKNENSTKNKINIAN